MAKTTAAPKPTVARPATPRPSAVPVVSNGRAAPTRTSSATTTDGKLAAKSQVHDLLAQATGLSRKQVGAVLDSLVTLARNQLGKKGPGIFAIHGLVKFKLVRKPATKAKKGTNPFTKEPMLIKARPARNVVKAVPLKLLKDLA